MTDIIKIYNWKQNEYYTNTLPGHSWVLQTTSDTFLPIQSKPYGSGLGLLQYLTLSLIPPLHGAEQSDNSNQAPQLPFTEKMGGGGNLLLNLYFYMNDRYIFMTL